MDEKFDKAKNKVLRYLSYRPRSIHETKRFLQLKSYSEEVIAKVINQLTEVGMLGDEQFAAWWVETRSRSKPSGPLKLKAELKQKGVPDQIIDQSTKLNYVDLAKKAYQKRAAKLTEKDKRKRKQKLIAFLQRRGFTWPQINTVHN